MEEVEKKYLPYTTGELLTWPFIIYQRAQAIGYIQWYRIADHPDYHRHLGVSEEAAGVDLFIGSPDHIHTGLGAMILRLFLREVVFRESPCVSCIVGPEVSNKAAIRAYEKAGFRYLKQVEIPDEEAPEYLMRISREELMGDSAK